MNRIFGRTLRSFSTTTLRSSETTAYPFAKDAVISQSSLPESLNLGALRRGRGLIEYVRKELVPPEKKQWLETLFSRNHPDRLLPGSVVSVVLNHAPSTFTGVLISLRRRGVDSSIVLRNVVQRIGTELQVFVGSPHLKEIKVIQRASGKKGEGKRMRRAKLFYLRDSPEKMSAISVGKRR
ncbi:hypothetical protein SISSUDRAFT_1055942 [Sistotremastrum suecicum HHB10207 ss-3]|uniref:Ribosomal protein L19 n=1 Tax=Sistotremastrum suecicum HHB10207 ss-3 TaxID=1314776 RepID=A0A165XEW2_9AGAM|nr:hypothetical protein SISSUDRAFT_1055942 [Sistotremastrum suecicum HHB10207 ss-3]